MKIAGPNLNWNKSVYVAADVAISRDKGEIPVKNPEQSLLRVSVW